MAFEGTVQAINQIIQNQRMMRSPAYQAQVRAQQLQNQQTMFQMEQLKQAKAMQDSILEYIATAPNLTEAQKVVYKYRPDLAAQQIIDQVQKDALVDLANRGEWNTLAVMTGQTPPAMEGEAAEAQLRAQYVPDIVKDRQADVIQKTDQRIREIQETGRQQRLTNTAEFKIETATGKNLNRFDAKRLDQAATQIAKLENIPVILNSLESQWKELDPESGLVGKLDAIGKKALGDIGFKAYAGSSAYDQTTLGISKQVSRSLGDVGNIAVQEQEINRKMLPRSTDNVEQGEKKLANLRELVNSILNSEYDRAAEILSKSGVEYTMKASGGIQTQTTPAIQQTQTQPTIEQNDAYQSFFNEYNQRRSSGATGGY